MRDVTFAAIYERYAQDVYRFALYLSGNRSLAEDLAAETFSRAWVARDRIRVGTVKAYLLMITRNLYRDLTRKGTDVPVAGVWSLTDTAPDPESATIAHSELEAVLAALRALPESERSVLLMATVGGVAYDAIAVAFGITAAAVKVRVYRARVKLNAARSAKEPT
jgi:RNA polymerase sigma-70 factor (ECF subfamily)